MNRINEYLKKLDKKNLIMLYFSILIIVFILGYYIYQNVFFQKYERLNSQKTLLIKKIREIKSNNHEVLKLKKIYNNEKIKVNSLKEDLNYLSAFAYSVPEINTPKNIYLNIMDKYLQIGSNLNASFEFNQTTKLNKYNIYIFGKFMPDKYFIFLNFLKTLQKPKAIITINSFDLNYKNYIVYDINLSIWSIK